jgi:eukaryotic-like serine/threonine-protein kinase
MDAPRREFETAPTSELIDSIVLEAVTTPPTSKFVRGVHPSKSDLEPLESDAVNAMIGRQIGPYQVTAWIGGSRIGNVYRATRTEEFARPVAILLIKHKMDCEIILRRFQTESCRQAALGKHPNITSLVDAGTTEDYRPYFVMEYVEGQHINEYCSSRRLDVPARLRLFAQVCHAVHFAHQHAVIHRDLKPSKILVTPDGAPKITDFGIVELIQPEAGDDQAAISMKPLLSGAGALVITPEYASPEQVKGGTVTTASDVYSLGVVLYQLVSGRQPYRFTSWSDSEIFQAICEQVPEKPSTAIMRRPDARPELSGDLLPSVPRGSATELFAAPVPLSVPPLLSTPDEIASARGLTPHRLTRILAGDLDQIVLMALRKEPERRYASAEQLGDDLHRYLKGGPVRAHRDSRVYRANKFVRRHAVAVGAGFLVLLALVAGIIATTTSLVTVRRQRDRTADSFRQASQTIDQLFTHISEERLLNQPGMYPLRKALLLDARRFYEDFLNQHGAGRELHAELATAHTRLAKITSLTGSKPEAVIQYRQAVALWEKLVWKKPDNPDYQANLAQTLNDLGIVLLHVEGRLDEALDTFCQAQKMIELLISVHPESFSQRLALGLVLQNIAEIQRLQGKPDKAITSIERALTIESQLAAEGIQSLETRIALATAHATLGRVFAGQPAESLPAIAAYHRAIELRDEVTRERPELAEQSYQLASDLSDLSSLEQKFGQTEPSVANLRRAMQIFERIDLFYPGVASYQHGLGTAYNMLSNLERQRGERAEALVFAQNARSLFERLVSENPKNAFFLRDLAKSHNNLGRLHAQAGDSAEALRSFQRAVDLFESLHALDPADSYNLACNVALSIPLIGVKKGAQGTAQELSRGDQLRRQLYGTRAIEALRRAADGGALNPQTLQDEIDLDSLRARADFQALAKEVEEKPATARKSS